MSTSMNVDQNRPLLKVILNVTNFHIHEIFTKKYLLSHKDHEKIT